MTRTAARPLLLLTALAMACVTSHAEAAMADKRVEKLAERIVSSDTPSAALDRLAKARSQVSPIPSRVLHRAVELAVERLTDETPDTNREVLEVVACGAAGCRPTARFELSMPDDAWVPPDQPRTDSGDPRLEPPVKLYAPPPSFPEPARLARLSGAVIIQAVLDREGKIADHRILQALPLGLTDAALEAVRQWRFRPAMLDGEPINVYYNLVVNFRLPWEK